MANPNIIVPNWSDPEAHKAKMAAIAAAENDFIPIRILCPGCKQVFPLYLESLEQPIYTILGQACPHCKRFISEKDDPDKLLVDANEIKQMLKEETEKTKR